MKNNSSLHRKYIKPGDMVFNFFNITFFSLFTLLCFYPFYYVVINSLSEATLVKTGGALLYPVGIHLQNYTKAMQLRGIPRATLVSFARTVLGTMAMLISVTVLGYAMSKPEYWHKRFWYRFLVITMYFGAGIIPNYLNMKRLGLLDNFWVYVIPAFVAPYNMILVKTYIESIPASLEEAAFIDGAGYFDRFFRIVLPLSKPILATVTVFTAVGQWNSYMDTILYMFGSENQTLQSILYTYLTQSNRLASLMREGGMANAEEALSKVNPQSIRLTITVIALIPIFLVYPFFQKYFTKGIMIGAVKG